MNLTPEQQAMAKGAFGPGVSFAMALLSHFGQAVGARSLIPIVSAHIDGCLYHGRVSMDFVRRFLDSGCRVRVPTTLNVGSIDLIHPELFAGDAEQAGAARQLMEMHMALGCASTFTCAPYQTLIRPRLGEQIAWAESNAIVFANSVLGARTARYGDFIDLAAAITGHAPAHSLHLVENRRGKILFHIADAALHSFAPDVLAVAVGLCVGEEAGDAVPVIAGLPMSLGEDQLKALGAAAASTGQVAMFHAVGLTPEASDVATACQGLAPEREVLLDVKRLKSAVDQLSSVGEGAALSAVCLGTPHFSLQEFAALRQLLLSRAPKVPIYVNTGRAIADELQRLGWSDDLARAGIVIVVDTCTYVTTILRDLSQAVMTNSGKWALYAPGNIGAKVAYGSLEACVASAYAGYVRR